MYTTPLRYPGGKSVISPFLANLFIINGWEHIVYAEPYAGGAGAAINLLLSNQVDRIMINDANVGIYSFWWAVCNENERFCDWVMEQPVDLDAWAHWHRIFQSGEQPSFDLGFATFFLTRTNRSGILNAGPIGGNSPQKQELAKYRIDCRFNREKLVQRIQNIGRERDRILVSNLDAILFLRQNNRTPNMFVYLDPPYYEQGRSLYMSYYRPNDHIELARFLEAEAQFNWVLSYDSVDEIKAFYHNFDLLEYSIHYSARTARLGREILASKPGIQLPDEIKLIK